MGTSSDSREAACSLSIATGLLRPGRASHSEWLDRGTPFRAALPSSVESPRLTWPTSAATVRLSSRRNGPRWVLFAVGRLRRTLWVAPRGHVLVVVRTHQGLWPRRIRPDRFTMIGVRGAKREATRQPTDRFEILETPGRRPEPASLLAGAASAGSLAAGSPWLPMTTFATLCARRAVSCSAMPQVPRESCRASRAQTVAIRSRRTSRRRVALHRSAPRAPRRGAVRRGQGGHEVRAMAKLQVPPVSMASTVWQPIDPLTGGETDRI